MEQKYSILVVDDEPSIIKLVKHRLGTEEYDLRSAADGIEAIECIEHEVPDLVLLDIIMPRMDGFQVLQWIRERDVDTGVLIFSARHELVDMRMGYSLDADFYLPKPFTTSELIRGIQTVLSLRPFLIHEDKES